MKLRQKEMIEHTLIEE